MANRSSNNQSSSPAGTVGQSGQSGQKWPGITAPLNLAAPKEADLVQTVLLEECLRSFDLFESEEELNHRMNVLSLINELVKAWIASVSEKRKIPQEIAEHMNGKIFTFGSFRLGVHTKGSLKEYCVKQIANCL